MRRFVFWVVVVAVLSAACSETTGAGESASTTTSPTLVTTSPALGSSSTTLATSTSAPTTTAIASGPGRGGAVVVAEDQSPSTLNPFVAGGSDSIVTTVGQAHLAGAWDVDATTRELIPELVLEIPSLDNGGVVTESNGRMTVRWRIRDEAVWSDGEPITGEDFAFTVEQVPEMSVGCSVASSPAEVPFRVIEVGEKTITLEFDTPSLAYETFFEWVIPEHVVAGTNFCEDWNDRMWPAAGPFVVDEVVPQEKVLLRRNENYWKRDAATGERLPWLDRVEFRFIPDFELLLASFADHEVEVIQPPPFSETIQMLQALDPVDLQVIAGPVWEHFNFQFGPNNRNEATMNELAAYRRAIAYAIDLDAMNQVYPFHGYQTPASSFLETFTPAATRHPWSEYVFDPDRARAELAKACEEAGRDCVAEPPTVVFSTTSNADTRPALAEQLESQLEGVGFQVELQSEDSQKYFGPTLEEGTWDMGLWAWLGSPGAAAIVDIFRIFDPDGPPPEGDNYYRWGTVGTPTRNDAAVGRFRELLAEIRATASRDRVYELAAEMEEILAAEAVIIPVWSHLTVGAAWADAIGGFQHNPTQLGNSWNIERWYRVDR